MVDVVGGGSLINGAYPVKFFLLYPCYRPSLMFNCFLTLSLGAVLKQLHVAVIGIHTAMVWCPPHCQSLVPHTARVWSPPPLVHSFSGSHQSGMEATGNLSGYSLASW